MFARWRWDKFVCSRQGQNKKNISRFCGERVMRLHDVVNQAGLNTSKQLFTQIWSFYKKKVQSRRRFVARVWLVPTDVSKCAHCVNFHLFFRTFCFPTPHPAPLWRLHTHGGGCEPSIFCSFLSTTHEQLGKYSPLSIAASVNLFPTVITLVREAFLKFFKKPKLKTSPRALPVTPRHQQCEILPDCLSHISTPRFPNPPPSRYHLQEDS